MPSRVGFHSASSGVFLAHDRRYAPGRVRSASVLSSVAVLAEIVLRSPRKLFIFIMKNTFFLDQSIQNKI